MKRALPVIVLASLSMFVGCNKKQSAPAPTMSTSSTDSVVATAQKYYDEAKQMIASKDFAGAKDMISKLQGMQSQLPAEWQTKIADLNKMLTDSQSAMNSMNGMMGK